MATHLQTATTEKKQLTVIAWIRGGQRIACAYRHIDGPNYYPLTLVRRPQLELWQWPRAAVGQCTAIADHRGFPVGVIGGGHAWNIVLPEHGETGPHHLILGRQIKPNLE